MKKNLIAAMAAMAMLSMTVTGCGSSAGSAQSNGADAAGAAESSSVAGGDQTDAAQAAMDNTEGRKTLIVGFDAEFPPYGFMDENGDYVGFDLELAEEVCSRRGWELVKQPIDWDVKDMELSSGAIDCIWNGFTINGRENDYTWSVPYVDNSQVFVVSADAGIAKKTDLAGRVVGVQKESSALAALEDEESQENLDLAASFANLVQYADYNTAFMDLEAGAIDAVALDIGVANYQIGQRPEGAFVILTEQLSSEQYAIGFLKGNETLKNDVEGTLLEMAADGTFMKIAEKYADYGVTDSVCLGN